MGSVLVRKAEIIGGFYRFPATTRLVLQHAALIALDNRDAKPDRTPAKDGKDRPAQIYYEAREKALSVLKITSQQFNRAMKRLKDKDLVTVQQRACRGRTAIYRLRIAEVYAEIESAENAAANLESP